MWYDPRVKIPDEEHLYWFVVGEDITKAMLGYFIKAKEPVNFIGYFQDLRDKRYVVYQIEGLADNAFNHNVTQYQLAVPLI